MRKILAGIFIALLTGLFIALRFELVEDNQVLKQQAQIVFFGMTIPIFWLSVRDADSIGEHIKSAVMLLVYIFIFIYVLYEPI